MTESKWNKELKAKIIARAWKDENFRNQLINNPKATLKALGIDLPANIDLKVICDDPTHIHFVLPQAPIEAKKLAMSELAKLSAAFAETNWEKGDPWYVWCWNFKF